LGYPINLLNVEEGPAYGAALIAGVGVGVFNSFETVADNIIKIKKTVQPNKENVKKYKKYYELYRELYPSLKNKYKKLSELN